MKKKIGLFLGLLAISVALIACSEKSVEASLPSGFEIVSVDDMGRINNQVYTLKHIRTGCFYALSDKRDSSGGTSITQMFVEKNNMSVPYCEEVIK